MFLAWYTLLVYDLKFTTSCWSATSSLLHLNQGLARPEVRGTAEPHGGAYPP